MRAESVAVTINNICRQRTSLLWAKFSHEWQEPSTPFTSMFLRSCKTCWTRGRLPIAPFVIGRLPSPQQVSRVESRAPQHRKPKNRNSSTAIRMELVMRSWEHFRVLRRLSLDSSHRQRQRRRRRKCRTNRNEQDCELIKACVYHRSVTWSALRWSAKVRSANHRQLASCVSPWTIITVIIHRRRSLFLDKLKHERRDKVRLQLATECLECVLFFSFVIDLLSFHLWTQFVAFSFRLPVSACCSILCCLISDQRNMFSLHFFLPPSPHVRAYRRRNF